MILILGNLEMSSFKLIKNNSPNFFSNKYLQNYTSAINFFITDNEKNEFHQGNGKKVIKTKKNLI